MTSNAKQPSKSRRIVKDHQSSTGNWRSTLIRMQAAPLAVPEPISKKSAKSKSAKTKSKK